MVQRTSFAAAECPIARSLQALGDGWSLLILRDAFLGIRRFSEFQKHLGVAKNILASRLKTLVAEGLLRTEPAADGSAYQDYVLTPKGREAFPVLVALRQWGEEHAFAGERVRTTLVDRKSRKPVGKLELRAADGRLLSAADTELQATAAPRNRRATARA
jgi:DNA-binding HxlR family transcriptional regulator